MAILTGLAATIEQGGDTGQVTFDLTEFLTDFSGAIDDAYFTDEANIKQVVFNYQSSVGHQPDALKFKAPGYTSKFGVSDTARVGAVLCNSITIIDNDNGSYSVSRAAFPVADAFDTEVVEAPPAFGSGDLFPAHTDSFSISVWVKLSAIGLDHTIFSNRENDGGNNRGVMLWQNASNNLFCYLVGTGTSLNASTTGITDTNWHHISVSYDGSNLLSGVKFYVDGTLQATGGSGTVSGTLVGTGPAVLGSYVNTPAFYFSGLMDEFSFYRDHVLTGGQVTAIYNGGSPNDLSALGSSSDMNCWLRFEDSLAPADSWTGTIYDRTGNSHDGTGTGTAGGFSATVAGGVFTTQSANFDGSNDKVVLA